MKITDFTAFAKMTDEEREAQFASMTPEDIEASLAEAHEQATKVFAIEEPKRTVADADKATDLVASLGLLDAEKANRAKIAQEAADRFAAAQAAFSNAGTEADSADEEESDEESDETEDADTDAEEESDEESDETEDAEGEGEGEGEGEAEATQTASAIDQRRSQALGKPSAASKVGRKTTRPAVKAAQQAVTITAAANIEGFGAGQPIEGMSKVAEAVLAVAKSLPKFNRHQQRAGHETSGGKPVLHKTSTAAFNIDVPGALTASSGKGNVERDHEVVKTAVKEHVDRVIAAMGAGGNPAVQTAAMAWCSPSEVVYNWIADFVVDGLLDLPEVAAPRGGLMMTEGPQLLQGTYDDSAVGIDEDGDYNDADEPYGFGGTEAEMEAGYIKECETIECPDFVDHRLDFTGYCWKIPLLTEATFPELVADAMRVADVSFAHKMNRRYIGDILRGSTAIDATSALGGTMLDTLEAFTQVAIKERRWWNLGENAVMEVKLPQVARYIFQFDMARRSGLALTDTATEQKVAAHFAAYNLSVKYLSDFDQQYGGATPTAAWPETIRGIMYPVGTWLKSVKPVVNLSTVYDAASLSENEYTGVFFEQGVMTIRRGYRSHKITIPVCVAGRTGANDLTCTGFDVPAFDGSF